MKEYLINILKIQLVYLGSIDYQPFTAGVTKKKKKNLIATGADDKDLIA